ncbi:hypothetical protein QBC47DRAFT_30142 [Echria macrotheca]|uniref:Uncharacterized protein n=1 Tax=Echria macrotheca TaxID=438768 RepID=A0AAJ0BNC3_9PEZI|nr:hypothetical protein QBC47DRAFT_30142 [Echria macrotheca]
MLRLGLSVISLTMGEVKDYEIRRRFRRYLETEDEPNRPSNSWAAQAETPMGYQDSSLPTPTRVSLETAHRDKQGSSSLSTTRELTPIANTARQVALGEMAEQESPLASARRRRDAQMLSCVRDAQSVDLLGYAVGSTTGHEQVSNPDMAAPERFPAELPTRQLLPPPSTPARRQGFQRRDAEGDVVQGGDANRTPEIDREMNARPRHGQLAIRSRRRSPPGAQGNVSSVNPVVRELLYLLSSRF